MNVKNRRKRRLGGFFFVFIHVSNSSSNFGWDNRTKLEGKGGHIISDYFSSIILSAIASYCEWRL